MHYSWHDKKLIWKKAKFCVIGFYKARCVLLNVTPSKSKCTRAQSEAGLFRSELEDQSYKIKFVLKKTKLIFNS